MKQQSEFATFKEYIAYRVENTKHLASEKREAEPEEVALDIFRPINYLDIPVEIPLIVNGRLFFNLSEEKLKGAELKGQWLRFSWDYMGESGSRIFECSEWRKGAIMRQKVFNYADKPMQLIGNFLND